MRTEEKPMIARDELAARCLVALLSNAGRVGHGSNVVDAVTCADALIARLASRPLAALSPAPVVGAPHGVDSKEQTFTCPKCGSHGFGTSNCTSPYSAWVGHCDNHNCGFSWPRELDDAKYFTPASPVPPAYPVDDKGRPLWVRFVADHSNDKATPRRVLEWDGDVATVEGISPDRKPNGCKPSAKAGEWEPCAAPAETPAAAQDAGLTEAEREACAKACEEIARRYGAAMREEAYVATECAAAIRARGAS